MIGVWFKILMYFFKRTISNIHSSTKCSLNYYYLSWEEHRGCFWATTKEKSHLPLPCYRLFAFAICILPSQRRSTLLNYHLSIIQQKQNKNTFWSHQRTSTDRNAQTKISALHSFTIYWVCRILCIRIPSQRSLNDAIYSHSSVDFELRQHPLIAAHVLSGTRPCHTAGQCTALSICYFRLGCDASK